VRWDFGYCGHYWPIVPAPNDRWWWLWRNWWNEDWQGKPKCSEKTCPSLTLSTTNPTWLEPGLNQGHRGGKPATICLSYGAALDICLVSVVTAHGLYDQGIGRGKRSLFLHGIQPSFGTHPGFCLVNTGRCSPWLKWLQHEVDHSAPSNTNIEELYPPHPLFIFMVCIHCITPVFFIQTRFGANWTTVFEMVWCGLSRGWDLKARR
jgi:hypothetical protein